MPRRTGRRAPAGCRRRRAACAAQAAAQPALAPRATAWRARESGGGAGGRTGVQRSVAGGEGRRRGARHVSAAPRDVARALVPRVGTTRSLTESRPAPQLCDHRCGARSKMPMTLYNKDGTPARPEDVAAVRPCVALAPAFVLAQGGAPEQPGWDSSEAEARARRRTPYTQQKGEFVLLVVPRRCDVFIVVP